SDARVTRMADIRCFRLHGTSITNLYPLSLHDALPISGVAAALHIQLVGLLFGKPEHVAGARGCFGSGAGAGSADAGGAWDGERRWEEDTPEHEAHVEDDCGVVPERLWSVRERGAVRCG